MIPPPPLSPWRWPLYAAGTAMIGWGVWGQLYGADTKPVRVAMLWLVAALAHDLVLAPLLVALGWLGRRALPGRVRGSVQAGFLVAGVLVLLAVPALGRFGAKADNPSVLPRDYPRGLLIALALVLLGTVVHAVLHGLTHRPRRAP